MSRKSLLGGAAPLYQAQESSFLLMQAKCWACCPFTVLSITQSNHRHSAGPLMAHGTDVQRVIWRPGTNRKSWDSLFSKKEIKACLLQQMGLYPAITAHCVMLSKALLLGGTCGLPGHEEVAERDVHRPVSLQFALRAKRVRVIGTCRKLMWNSFSIMWKLE